MYRIIIEITKNGMSTVHGLSPKMWSNMRSRLRKDCGDFSIKSVPRGVSSIIRSYECGCEVI
jgi:hypothetical protein